MNITKLSVSELKKLLSAREISSVEITEAFLSNIEKTDNEIGAYITITKERALSDARVADKAISNGTASVLTGIPGAIKDNICTKNVLTTCASKMLGNFVPPYSATVADKLQEQKTVLLGKTNMDEFAMGSSTENSYFKKTKNPVDTTRVPGGSSGGSAACVAAYEAPFALGSDTGGSIRQPASFCGVVGLKPTYGSVSRYGLVAFASSLDQIGPLTHSVLDSALVYDAIRGYDKRDSTSIDRQYEDSVKNIERSVKGLKIAMPKEYFADGINREVRSAVLDAAKKFESMGARIVETSTPSIRHALPAYYVISSSEASSNLARFDGVKYGYRSEDFESIDELYKLTRSEGFGPEVQRRIMLGSFALSAGYYDAYYKKALQVRTLIVRDFKKVFDECDLILSPVCPTTAYKLGEKSENPIEMYMGDMYTVPVNIAGIPALSLPCGKDSGNLPIGMQLIGPAFSESLLFAAGHAFETNV